MLPSTDWEVPPSKIAALKLALWALKIGSETTVAVEAGVAGATSAKIIATTVLILNFFKISSVLCRRHCAVEVL